MVGWHYHPYGRESEQTPGDSGGQEPGMLLFVG